MIRSAVIGPILSAALAATASADPLGEALPGAWRPEPARPVD